MQPKPEINSYSNNNSSSSDSKRKTATTTTTTIGNNNRQQETATTSIFLQQQKHDKHKQQQIPIPPSTTTTTTTRRKTTTSSAVVYPRVIKSRQPLINFKFYLDIHDHQQTRFIEKQIKLLGGKQEFFLDDATNITHFITDKAELSAIVLNTTTTTTPPQTPISVESNKHATPTSSSATAAAAVRNNCGTYKVAQTRADAILSRVRQQQQQTTTTTTTPVTAGTTINYKIWQIEYALRFFKKVQHELKTYLQPDNKLTGTAVAVADKIEEVALTTTTADIKTFKGNFIKIEAIKRNRRPYYHLFSPFDWPKLSLNTDEGAFSLVAQQQQLLTTMTRKSRARATLAATTPTKATLPTTTTITTTPTVAAVVATTTTTTQSQCQKLKDTSDKQCGMCELCKIEYETLTIHLKTKDHEYFAKNAQNFIALDTLIQNSADVNKFLNEDVVNMGERNIVEKNIMEEMEVEVEEQNLTHMDVDAPDPLEQPLEANNLSPPLRERSKRSTKGKHSSEKFQNKRTRATTATTATTITTPVKSPPKTLEVTPIKNARRKSTITKNLSSPIRPFPPPSSLYKVVETSQMEHTPKRGCALIGGRATAENVTASPSLIVKFKKVRNTQLMREAESFMFPKQQQQQQQQQQQHRQRCASSELPTDMDRPSSSERMRTSIYSSSSLDSSSISDIVVNMESPVPAELQLQEESSLTTIRNSNRKRQSFQSTPIQPDVQMKRLRKPTTIFTPTKSANRTPKTTTTTTTTKKKNNNNNKRVVVDVANLSPPSAAAAIVAATANITLPAATRKSSRMATAIVSAATTSSRLLRAAAEEIKKSVKTAATVNSRRNSTNTTNTIIAATTKAITTNRTRTVKKTKCEEQETLVSAENNEIAPTTTTTPNSRMRRCRFVAQSAAAVAAVVEMEDRMGESSATEEEEDDDDDDDDVHDDEIKEEKEKEETEIKKELIIRRRTRMKTQLVKMELHNDDDNDVDDVDDDDDDDDEVDNDDKADKDFKYRYKRKVRKPLKRRYKRKKIQIKNKKKKIIVKTTNKSNNCKIETVNSIKTQRKVTKPYYDYTKSERIQASNYAFERVPENDLWYRVFMRQDEGGEEFFEYYGNTHYYKLPYELGPIPYTHTKPSRNCCKLCQPLEENINMEKSVNNDVNIKTETNAENIEKSISADVATVTATAPTPYALKHKKLHLLQRYRQEQEALQQRQKQEDESKFKQQQQQQKENLANLEISNGLQCDIERAGSPHSTSSSCASSSTVTMQHVKKTTTAFRNKLLNKAAFLSNLEMPPRKSPREHASTLALVSIIKQRQESKPNSDAEEANSVPSTPIPNEDVTATVATKIRSAAGTPIEEMCFATEISENVKRMRRGRNKYDHSPPYVLNKSRRLPRPKLNNKTATTAITTMEKHEKQPVNIKKEEKEQLVKEEKPLEGAKKPQLIIEESPNKCNFRIKQKTQLKLPTTITAKTTQTTTTAAKVTMAGFENSTLHSKTNNNNNNNNLVPSIRKTGQKKGVLEFAVDENALKALDAVLEPTISVRQLERDIDEFLECTGKDLDMDELSLFGNMNAKVEEVLDEKKKESAIKVQKSAPAQCLDGESVATNTPPATDYFSSDFDLCDLLLEAQNTLLGVEEAKKRSHESKHMSLYNTMALNRYFRKRKYMKSNRTGWPKIQKKKYSMRHQSVVAANGEDTVKTVITPPDSEGNAAHINQKENLVNQTIAEGEELIDEDEDVEEDTNDKISMKSQNLIQQDDSDDGDTFYDGAESIPEEDDGDTMVGSVVEDVDEDEEQEENVTNVNNTVVTEHLDEYEKAVEADDEDELNDGLEAEIDENTMPDEEPNKAVVHAEKSKNNHDEKEEHEEQDAEEDVYATKTKRSRRTSSLGKALANCLNSLTNNKTEDVLEEDTNSMTAATSTPITNMARALRRTPQLNGSLASCNSPTERAGDNSDIFTVSSDGLETDLDLSNPHANSNSKNDEHQHQKQNNSKGNKYDITKYVKNPAANTCAAEAATAAAKSLAIAQFLKKEVRVTCRRIRAPFRRFRYRR